jgi:hypothetical protein
MRPVRAFGCFASCEELEVADDRGWNGASNDYLEVALSIVLEDACLTFPEDQNKVGVQRQANVEAVYLTKVQLDRTTLNCCYVRLIHGASLVLRLG